MNIKYNIEHNDLNFNEEMDSGVKMFNLTFQQIQMFIAVAKRLNISAVAEDMYVSQAALSKMIQRLEDSLGVKLFVRNRRGLKLTAEGELLYKRIVMPFGSICDAITEVQNMIPGNQASLKIGYPMTIDVNEDYSNLNIFINNYKKKHSNVEFLEGVYNFEELKNMLRYGKADVIFIPNFEMYNFDDDNIDSKSILWYPLYIAVGAFNPARKGESLNLDILRRQPIYTLPGDGRAESIEALLEEIEYNIVDKRVVPNQDTLIRTLKNNDWGFAVIGNQQFDDKRGVKLFSVTKESYNLSLHMAWRSDNTNAELKSFIKAISDNMDKFTKNRV